MGDDTHGDNILPKVAVGAAVVAGVTAVAAVLSNEDNREKLQEGADKAMEKGAEVVEDIKQKGAQVGTQAVTMVVEQYNALRAKIDAFMQDDDNKDKAEELKKAADAISHSIDHAKSEGEDVAQQLVEDIKDALTKLSENMAKMEEKA